ncbi:MAG: outer membrane lipoprotein carrier protein LolA [Alphaproteobacteria bacterium]|nr:outer membrane lipoprotein carrier protein LolA [Alphaproteobacteria bacterium]
MPPMMFELFLSLVLLAQDAPEADTDSAPAGAAVTALSEIETASPDVFDTEAALTGVNGWLNSVETYRARFTQIAPDFSASTGILSIRRPGRLRFEYDAPSPLLVVADGTTVAIEDADLETVDRVPLRSTPLWWLLKPDVNLSEDANVGDVWQEDGFIYVAMQDRNEEMDGTALFAFNPETYALEEWFVTDSLGYTTRVTLSDVETGVRLNPRLFVLDEPEDDRRRRQ